VLSKRSSGAGALRLRASRVDLSQIEEHPLTLLAAGAPTPVSKRPVQVPRLRAGVGASHVTRYAQLYRPEGVAWPP
jgi:hypothetical protein